MLVKSFIDIDTANLLLAWSNTQNIHKNISNGKNGYFSRLDQLSNIPKVINEIRNKCIAVVNGIYQEPVYKDFVNEILPNGYVNEHTDQNGLKNYKHIRCNILLQKPEIGGNIVINKNLINMNVGDLCIVDTHLPHEVTLIKGKVSFKCISFGFLCSDIQ